MHANHLKSNDLDLFPLYHELQKVNIQGIFSNLETLCKIRTFGLRKNYTNLPCYHNARTPVICRCLGTDWGIISHYCFFHAPLL